MDSDDLRHRLRLVKGAKSSKMPPLRPFRHLPSGAHPACHRLWSCPAPIDTDEEGPRTRWEEEVVALMLIGTIVLMALEILRALGLVYY